MPRPGLMELNEPSSMIVPQQLGINNLGASIDAPSSFDHQAACFRRAFGAYIHAC